MPRRPALFFAGIPRHTSAMRILVLFAHPRLSESVVQRAMLSAIEGLDGVTLHDLYAAYPDFDIDIDREQALLAAHDVIVFQHPFYWYSSPAIVKEWMDLVLEHGWAYGPGGAMLHGKFMMQAISTGGPQGAYHARGRNRFEIAELLAPFNQTAYLCGMGWLEPFVIYVGRHLESAELAGRAQAYRDLIIALRDAKHPPMKHVHKGFPLPTNFTARA
jgi:glutathione-regulated potassium-efflux system ancillary protein KefG